MIHIHEWHCDSKKCTLIEPHNLEELPPPTEGGMVWIDLENPTVEEEEKVFQKYLPVHPLVMEDIRRPIVQGSPHLPKAEEWEDYLFVIINPLDAQMLLSDQCRTREDQRLSMQQLSAVLGEQILITHHTRPIPAISELHQRLQREYTIKQRGPDYLFHWLLDTLVDSYAPLIDTIVEKLDDLEEETFQNPKPLQMQELIRLKGQVIQLRKSMILEREVLARLMRGEFELVSEGEVVYYRNVYDHLLRYTELIEGSREMISDLMQMHLASLSNRMNAIMKTLAIISTVIMPMTLLASIYGMNFEWMPGLKDAAGFWYALGAMGILGCLSVGFFRWRMWV